MYMYLNINDKTELPNLVLLTVAIAVSGAGLYGSLLNSFTVTSLCFRLDLRGEPGYHGRNFLSLTTFVKQPPRARASGDVSESQITFLFRAVLIVSPSLA